MLRYVLGVLMAALPLMAVAGDNANVNRNVTAKRCSIEVAAEYYAVPVVFDGVQSGVPASIAELRSAVAGFDAQAEKAGIRVVKGEINLPLQSGGNSSSVFSRISRSCRTQDEAQTERTIMIRLDGNTDIFVAAVKAINFIGGLKLPKNIRCHVASGYLTVESPEQYRAQLLKLIGDDVRGIQTALGLGKCRYTLENLNSPIQIRAIDGSKVELFIEYRLSVAGE